MTKSNESTWKHPGRSSSDYSKRSYHDHDRRTYSSMGHFGKGPKNYQKTDSRIYEDVCEALYWDHDVDASEIEVKVENQIVCLSGRVDSRHAKKTAEKVIDGISGVKDVRNYLSIKPCLDLNTDKLITRGDDGLYSEETLER